MKLTQWLVQVMLAAAAFFGSAAQAVPITWTLQGAQFDDGGTASGWLMIESSTGGMIDWNLTTTAGATLPGFTYNSGTSFFAGRNYFGANPESYLWSNFSTEPYLHLGFAAALTAPGTVALVLTQDNAGSWECNNCFPFRYLTAGSVTSDGQVPEPATLALLGVAVCALASRRRRRQ